MDRNREREGRRRPARRRAASSGSAGEKAALAASLGAVAVVAFIGWMVLGSGPGPSVPPSVVRGEEGAGAEEETASRPAADRSDEVSSPAAEGPSRRDASTSTPDEATSDDASAPADEGSAGATGSSGEPATAEEPEDDAGPSHLAPRTEANRVRVAEIVDGDTLVLADGTHVRLVGINCPEEEMPFYEEATEFLARRVADREIRLELATEGTDEYGRALGYVFSGGALVNAELVRRGLAAMYTWHPNDRYEPTYLECQRAAREDGLGIWSLEPPEPAPYYVAYEGRHRFHRPDCDDIRGEPVADRRVFDERDAAYDAGLNPHSTCDP